MLTQTSPRTAVDGLLDVALPVEAYFDSLVVYRHVKDTPVGQVFWGLFKSSAVDLLGLDAPASLVTAARKLMPDAPRLEMNSSQLLLGFWPPPLEVPVALAWHFNRKWPGMGSDWLGALVKGLETWPAVPAPGTTAFHQYPATLQPFAVALKAQLANVTAQGKSVSTPVQGESWRKSPKAGGHGGRPAKKPAAGAAKPRLAP